MDENEALILAMAYGSDSALLSGSGLAGGSFRRTVRTVTTTATAALTDDYIEADATNGSFTITLPSAVLSRGRQIDIRKIDSTGNAITIDGLGSETINGETTQLLGAQYDSYTLLSNGTSWAIL